MEVITKSSEDTKSLGKRFSANLKGGEVVALVGDLGSGKTTFAQGFAQGLGIKENIISPSFILMRSYKINSPRHPELVSGSLYHLDLYRLEENINQELINIGFNEILEDKKGIILIEWAEKAKDFLPKKTKWVNFEYLNENERKITINK
jgi:tRNA threonylcarbamoyladenosine biosynthesis protein TsaE